jgi:AcrR family transcriptional regulator
MTRRARTDGITNREKILKVSIDLFSEKGYEAVTLREIASQVGIKAASIYNHFHNKEEILEEIAAFFIEKLHNVVYPYFKIEAGQDVRGFLQRVEDANIALFSEPLYAKIGSILLREQFHSEFIRKMLLEELIARPRQSIAEGFCQLMAAGKMKPADPVIAAKEYHAYYIYEFYENSLAQGAGLEGEGARKTGRDEHLRLFLDNFRVKD